MRALSSWFLPAFAGLDLGFKVLVGLGFFEVMGAQSGAKRDAIIELALPLAAALWTAWLVASYFVLRPLDRYVAAVRSGTLSDATVRRAARTGARAPMALALVWTSQWTILVATLVTTKSDFDLASANFVIAMITGPFPLAHAMTVWATGALRRDVDDEAAKRRLHLDLPPGTIRRRMIMYVTTIVIAPSAYMAAIGAAGALHDQSTSSLALSITIGYGAVVLFALLVTLLMSDMLTGPIATITRTVSRIARGEGDVRRIPLETRDEIGTLVATTNDMLTRLETDTTRRAQVELELALASKIQMSILPRGSAIAGLELATTMQTATRVGGDYFDILATPNGGWIAIGDVSGHGLSAGLIMLMLQSTTASFIAAFPDAPPAEQVVAINRVLTENLRGRLQGRDFVTYTLLGYDGKGGFRFAGAHEDMLVWRAKDRRCETIATPGTWLGVKPDIASVTVEGALALDAGDVLVLYTDGIVEAANKSKERFGLERLTAAVAKHATKPVDVIVAAIAGEVNEWAGELEDDITLVVARQVI